VRALPKTKLSDEERRAKEEKKARERKAEAEARLDEARAASMEAGE
jgi:hypothetical protein